MDQALLDGSVACRQVPGDFDVDLVDEPSSTTALLGRAASIRGVKRWTCWELAN